MVRTLLVANWSSFFVDAGVQWAAWEGTAMSRTTANAIIAGSLLVLGLIVAVGRCSGEVAPAWASVCQRLSLRDLPETVRPLVEFLVLIPLAALLVCVFRQVVGWTTFGTFSPALLGLAFRHPETWRGIPLLLGLLVIGWAGRQLLEPLRLLHVPRISALLSGLAVALLLAVVQGTRWGVPVAEFVHIFPLVILTGIVERMWLAGAEDGQASSVRTLGATLAAAAIIGWVTGRMSVVHWLLSFPETLAAIVAGQLFLGRYTGWRWTEWLRFRPLFISQTKVGPLEPSDRLRETALLPPSWRQRPETWPTDACSFEPGGLWLFADGLPGSGPRQSGDETSWS